MKWTVTCVIVLSYSSNNICMCGVMAGRGGGLNLLKFLWNVKFRWPDEWCLIPD